MLKDLSPRRRSLVGAGFVILVLLGLGVLWARAIEEPLRSDGVVPVILVHGYGGNAASMSTLAAALHNAGREVVAVELPASGTGDFASSVDAVEDAIDGARAPVVDLVGFSAGGVIVRAYVDDAGAGTRARHVVMLGAPNHGAELAGIAASTDPGACSGACAQLVPGSSFLTELNEPDETPGTAQYASIWTALDETVTPPASAVIDGAVNVRLQDVCPDSTAGHGDLVRDPLALGLVLEALDGRLATPPRPDRCMDLRRAGAA